MTEAKNSDYFGKSPFDDLQNVTNTVMDVIKQGRERKLAIAQATFEVSAKQQEELKKQQSEDVDSERAAAKRSKDAEEKRKKIERLKKAKASDQFMSRGERESGGGHA